MVWWTVRMLSAAPLRTASCLLCVSRHTTPLTSYWGNSHQQWPPPSSSALASLLRKALCRTMLKYPPSMLGEYLRSFPGCDVMDTACSGAQNGQPFTPQRVWQEATLWAKVLIPRGVWVCSDQLSFRTLQEGGWSFSWCFPSDRCPTTLLPPDIFQWEHFTPGCVHHHCVVLGQDTVWKTLRLILRDMIHEETVRWVCLPQRRERKEGLQCTGQWMKWKRVSWVTVVCGVLGVHEAWGD